jgi:hypothetical protein
VTEGTLPEAGWYPDPAQPGYLRWWTGQGWSDAVHPAATDEAISQPNPFPELEGSDEPARRDPSRRLWVTIGLISAFILVILGAMVALLSAMNRSNLDTSAAAAQISARLTSQFNMPISVQCPSHVPLEAGGVFECTASDQQGHQRTVRVTQTDDQGNIRFELAN